jgi:hypothetical protein
LTGPFARDIGKCFRENIRLTNAVGKRLIIVSDPRDIYRDNILKFALYMADFPLMPESNLSLFGWLVIKNLKKGKQENK